MGVYVVYCIQKNKCSERKSMRKVNVKVFKDRLEAEKTPVMRLCGGEDVCLVFYVPEFLRGEHKYYLRFSTAQQAKRGGMSVTGEIECKNGVILYCLPKSLTETENLGIQLLAVNEKERVFSPVLKEGLTFSEDRPCGQRNGTKTLFNFYDINDYAARKGELPF